ncbi:hypothetical protein ASM33_07115 [Wolbachia endosymbiont of Folsomia candida]|nr:hypothetical protein ASM33_07115 [Wolbachia endosymbiont of Folsomia candida]
MKSLREVCKKFAQDQLNEDQSWLKEALKNENEQINEYIPRIEFTASDIEQRSGTINLLRLTSPIWGRTEIEGRIICKEYGIKLHIVEKHTVQGEEIWTSQIVDESGSRSIDDIDYNEANTIHIVNKGHLHFEPILNKAGVRETVQQENRQSPPDNRQPRSDRQPESGASGQVNNPVGQSSLARQPNLGNQPIDSINNRADSSHQIHSRSSDSPDYDDDATPEEELINAVKSSDLEEEKLQKIRGLFAKELKPNVNFQGQNNDTPLHIAVRKQDLEVIRLLIANGADIHIKNDRSRSPLDIATRLGNHVIIGILQAHSQPIPGPSNQQASIGQPLVQQKRTRTDSDENTPEDSNPKKPRISGPEEVDREPESGPSSPKRSKLSSVGAGSSGQQAIPDDRPSQPVNIDKPRSPTGLLTSYHGVVYQIQWMMIVALESKKHSAISGFTFKTEVEDKDAGKFDDVVWQYKDDQQEDRYNFLQAKHKLNPSKTITLKDLLKPKQKDSSKPDKTDKRPFALEKYFTSYRDRIKTNPKYQNKKNEEQTGNLIIVTNIDLDEDLKNSFEKPENKIPVLEVISDIQSKKPEYWKIKESNSPDKEKIEQMLEGTYDLIKLARRLGECVLNNQPISLSTDNFLNPYSTVLEQNVIDTQANKFRNSFISGHKCTNVCYGK